MACLRSQPLDKEGLHNSAPSVALLGRADSLNTNQPLLRAEKAARGACARYIGTRMCILTPNRLIPSTFEYKLGREEGQIRPRRDDKPL